MVHRKGIPTRRKQPKNNPKTTQIQTTRLITITITITRAITRYKKQIQILTLRVRFHPRAKNRAEVVGKVFLFLMVAGFPHCKNT